MSVVSRSRRAWADWVGKRRYALGKLLLARGHYQDALEAFIAAERWFAEKYGPMHSSVGAALIKQGLCNAKLDHTDAACCAYRRALVVVDATVGQAHPQAVAIRAYLASECTNRDDAPLGTGASD